MRQVVAVGMRTGESLKDPRQCMFRDADAIVPNLNPARISLD
jgi:hypothetical protein